MSKIKIDKNKCKGCGLCVKYCPMNQIKVSSDLNEKGIHYVVFKDEGKCTGCCICARVCPDAAIEVYKGQKTEDRRQKTDNRRQRTEDRGQRTEGR